MSGPWEAEGVVERLKELHGMRPQISCNGIARKLSREFSVFISRNSVIGKTHRLGLEKREDVGFRGVNIKRRERSALRQAGIKPPPVRTERILPSKPPKPVQYTKSELRRMLTAAMLNTGGVLV